MLSFRMIGTNLMVPAPASSLLFGSNRRGVLTVRTLQRQLFLAAFPLFLSS